MNAFPDFQTTQAKALPLFRENAWDYETNQPVLKNGTPVIVEGLEAVKVWAWNVLHTPRCHHEIFTWDYGSELNKLIGKSSTDASNQAGLERLLKDCFLCFPYIKGVRDVKQQIHKSKLIISCTIETEYGSTEVVTNV